MLVGQETSDQVLFRIRASYSFYIASCQHLYLIACLNVEGSTVGIESVDAELALGLSELVRARVIMECVVVFEGR